MTQNLIDEFNDLTDEIKNKTEMIGKLKKELSSAKRKHKSLDLKINKDNFKDLIWLLQNPDHWNIHNAWFFAIPSYYGGCETYNCPRFIYLNWGVDPRKYAIHIPRIDTDTTKVISFATDWYPFMIKQNLPFDENASPMSIFMIGKWFIGINDDKVVRYSSREIYNPHTQEYDTVWDVYPENSISDAFTNAFK